MVPVQYVLVVEGGLFVGFEGVVGDETILEVDLSCAGGVGHGVGGRDGWIGGADGQVEVPHCREQAVLVEVGRA